MIANLIQAFECLSEEDAAFANTVAVSRATGTTRVELLLAAGSSDRVERWHVTAATLLDISFNFSVASRLSHTTSHPAAIAFNEPRFELYFRGIGPGPAAVLGALYAAHQAVGPATVPFERFFNTHHRLG